MTWKALILGGGIKVHINLAYHLDSQDCFCFFAARGSTFVVGASCPAVGDGSGVGCPPTVGDESGVGCLPAVGEVIDCI